MCPGTPIARSFGDNSGDLFRDRAVILGTVPEVWGQLAQHKQDVLRRELQLPMQYWPILWKFGGKELLT